MDMKKGIWIGLCGRSGTGKGYVSRLFALHGVPSVDTDAVYRRITAPADTPSACMVELVSAFGEEIRNADNSLNRKILSGIVFREDGSEDLRRLNSITHKHILKETERIAHSLFEDGAKAVLIDAPVLFESGFDDFCDCTLCVTAPFEVSLERIQKRDGITREEAVRRLSSQLPEEELIRRCDFRVVNGKNEKTLDEQVSAVLTGIFTRFPETEVNHER